MDGVSDLAERIHELYRTAPEGFVAARDELVKALKAEGADLDAAAVKRRKRPSVAAWALNQLADRDPAGLEELERAGATLRGSMSARGADALRDATAARRSIVTRLARETAEVLREADRSPDAHRDDVTSTLEAASVDDAVAGQLRAGTLERTVSGAVGFGEIGGLRLVETPEDDEEALSRPAHVDEAGRREELAGLKKVSAAAERAAHTAQTDLERRTTRVAKAEAQLATERYALREAEAAARGATLEARRAAAALERAERRSR
jgi:hypothetical protein